MPVFGGRAGGTSGLADWLSSWNRFLLLVPNGAAPLDWNRRIAATQICDMSVKNVLPEGEVGSEKL